MIFLNDLKTFLVIIFLNIVLDLQIFFNHLLIILNNTDEENNVLK